MGSYCGGHKIFVSYKFADCNVKPLSIHTGHITTVRDYVNYLANIIDDSKSIYKGERTDEDLSSMSERKIKEYLSDLIRDSSVTVLLFSPNMRNTAFLDDKQWIPWEIYCSLRRDKANGEHGRASFSNALLGAVLPDQGGHYEYFDYMRQFYIVERNRESNYIEITRWNSFIAHVDDLVEKARERQRNNSPFVQIMPSCAGPY